MGNCFGSPFDKVGNGTAKCFGVWREVEEHAAIDVDDADRENLGNESYDADSEERKKLERDEKESPLGSVVVTGVSYAAALGVPVHKQLYDSSKRRDEKLRRLDLDIEYNEKCRRRLQLLRPQKKDEQINDAVDECFVPITEEEKALVDWGLSNSNRTHILVSHDNSNIDITGDVLQCLKPLAWLNDEVINLYLALLKERENREPQKFLKCHFFNTFFYKKLSGRDGYNFQAVKRWTTKKKLGYNLLDCEKIFVPIHKNSHWCLAIINKKDIKFQYLDSLEVVDDSQVNQVMNVLARYYADEVKDKTGEDINVDSWEKEFVINRPQQENMSDCGMFMLKYVDFHSRDLGLYFYQKISWEKITMVYLDVYSDGLIWDFINPLGTDMVERHMPYFRQRTAKEILKLRAE